MIHKSLLVAAVLGLAGLLVGADAALARPGGGGGNRGGNGGGNRGVYRGGYYGGYGLGFYGLGGYGYGGYGGYSNAYPNYSFYPPSTDYYAPSDYSTQQAPPQKTGAGIRVIVPDSQAKIWFDGALTQQTGQDRFFETPSLPGGGTYSYRVQATWTQNGQQINQERVVNVTPGQLAVVDFTRPASEALPIPKK